MFLIVSIGDLPRIVRRLVCSNVTPSPVPYSRSSFRNAVSILRSFGPVRLVGMKARKYADHISIKAVFVARLLVNIRWCSFLDRLSPTARPNYIGAVSDRRWERFNHRILLHRVPR